MPLSLAFPLAGPLPSTPSAAVHHGIVRALHRYYEPVRLLTCSPTASSSRLPVATRERRGDAGQMRSPRFRRVPFVRDGVFDHGRASAPRIAAPHILPSTHPTVSASAGLCISRLNSPPHTIAVYASPLTSPSKTQNSLPGGSYPLPGPDSHRLDHASFAWRTKWTRRIGLRQKNTSRAPTRATCRPRSAASAGTTPVSPPPLCRTVDGRSWRRRQVRRCRDCHWAERWFRSSNRSMPWTPSRARVTLLRKARDRNALRLDLMHMVVHCGGETAVFLCRLQSSPSIGLR